MEVLPHHHLVILQLVVIGVLLGLVVHGENNLAVFALLLTGPFIGHHSHFLIVEQAFLTKVSLREVNLAVIIVLVVRVVVLDLVLRDTELGGLGEPHREVGRETFLTNVVIELVDVCGELVGFLAVTYGVFVAEYAGVVLFLEFIQEKVLQDGACAFIADVVRVVLVGGAVGGGDLETFLGDEKTRVLLVVDLIQVKTLHTGVGEDLVDEVLGGHLDFDPLVRQGVVVIVLNVHLLTVVLG